MFYYTYRKRQSHTTIHGLDSKTWNMQSKNLRLFITIICFIIEQIYSISMQWEAHLG